MLARFASLALSALVLASPALSLAADQPTRTQRLDAVVDRAIADNRIVGAVVLVFENGSPVYRRAVGWSDREARRPMTEDAIFRLGSLTKPVVSVAAMRLVEQGRLSVDDPVTKWLPGFTPRTGAGVQARISVHNLLTHTAGLSYGFMQPPDGAYRRLGISDGFDQPPLSLDENLARLSRAPLVRPPGTGWDYSLASDVLGALVERAAKTPLAPAVWRLVTQDLSMRDTDFVVPDRTRLVTTYLSGSPAPARMDRPTEARYGRSTLRFDPERALEERAYPSGGAGMVGSAGDVAKLLELVRTGGGTLLTKASIDRMTAAQVGPEAQTLGPGWGYGYDWAVLVDPAQAKTPQSPGTIQWSGEYGHSWFVDRRARLTVVVLTNTAFASASGRVDTEIRDAVYAVPSAPRP